MEIKENRTIFDVPRKAKFLYPEIEEKVAIIDFLTANRFLVREIKDGEIAVFPNYVNGKSNKFIPLLKCPKCKKLFYLLEICPFCRYKGKFKIISSKKPK